ncbi:threonine synthase [Helicobacter kayseriensis]|uniref:threonine synthase n=1 Tax=Helicobacter kayseriensis TaxID=2905877 RepID=UPI001E29FD6A|nr:threonine synthase [Helicobacter kayseriensis]MCE3047335.1 threonine synthase [Helicobacter kayseriensis]MCE3048706.1 threonine synthase [Helicobacter kayseriensis]
MQIFTQTRGGETPRITFKDSILNPKANFGGLYTLSNFPPLPSLDSLLNLDYATLTETIFSHLGLELDGLEKALASYKNFDNPLDPAPISHLHDQFYLQELYHGPSRAFKDMALQPLGRLFSSFAKNDKYLLLTATSGDTGPATLESFKGMKNIFVICLYPAEGTSDVQRLQMSTQDASNLKVIPIIGNFDDAQHALKTLLQDNAFLSDLTKLGFKISASNSVNFGRIAFQIIYHIWGYLSLVRQNKISLGESIYTVIPSGNFGNALGAFYARLMNLPLHKIIIASNPNNILTDFIQSGIYDISSRKLLQTYSPAMDILKSSNIERVLFALFGSERTKEWMISLDQHKSYQLSQEELQKLKTYFDAGFCSDQECLECIKSLAQQGKIIDPHTANAYAVAQTLPKDSKILINSTAEWSKFSPTIFYALTGQKANDRQALNWISSNFHLPLHPQVQSLFDKQELCSSPIAPHTIASTILQWLNE